VTEPPATGEPPADHLEIGRIGRAHGVRGESNVHFTSEIAERRAPGAEYFVFVGGRGRILVVESCRPHGDHHLVRFAGVDDRTAAEALVNATLWAPPLPSEDDTLWVHQLVGSRVVGVDGGEWGRCISVILNPAHDILELASGVLVPVTFVVSCADGVTLIDPPEGLDLRDGAGDDASDDRGAAPGRDSAR